MRARLPKLFRLTRKRDAYRAAFTGEHGDRVLRDLARFCGASRPSFDSDTHLMAYREGSRLVFLRIQRMLNLTDEQIRTICEQAGEDE